jgi:enoyl-CoA hydratase/carnithine racemase
LGLRGDVFDYGLQLLGEADTVVVAGDTRIADTSVGSGLPAVHAGRLSGSLPDAEINRLALLGASSAMTAARALELGLADEIVEVSNLEIRLVQRLLRYTGRA